MGWIYILIEGEFPTLHMETSSFIFHILILLYFKKYFLSSYCMPSILLVPKIKDEQGTTHAREAHSLVGDGQDHWCWS